MVIHEHLATATSARRLTCTPRRSVSSGGHGLWQSDYEFMTLIVTLLCWVSFHITILFQILQKLPGTSWCSLRHKRSGIRRLSSLLFLQFTALTVSVTFPKQVVSGPCWNMVMNRRNRVNLFK